MKKVIQHGSSRNPVKRFLCAECGCVFDADKIDYTEVFDLNEVYYYSYCPECGKRGFPFDEKS